MVCLKNIMFDEEWQCSYISDIPFIIFTDPLNFLLQKDKLIIVRSCRRSSDQNTEPNLGVKSWYHILYIIEASTWQLHETPEQIIHANGFVLPLHLTMFCNLFVFCNLFCIFFIILRSYEFADFFLLFFVNPTK